VHDRFFKSVARNEQIQSDRRSQVAELHRRQKNDTQVNLVDAVTGSNWQYSRDNQYDRRKNIEYGAKYQQE
jgi:hypothetical protein